MTIRSAVRNYSLIEDVDNMASYATYPVVHRWAYHFQSEDIRVELGQLAVIIVGWAVPHNSTREYSTMQRRLLPHAQACSRWASADKIRGRTRCHNIDNIDSDETEEKKAILNAVNNLGNLYADQGKLTEAEKMYERALRGYKEALGSGNVGTYRPALNTMLNRGYLYVKQRDLTKAREAYSRALLGFQTILGSSDSMCQNIEAEIKSLDALSGKLWYSTNLLT